MSVRRQAMMQEWVSTRLGVEAMESHERGLRFFEESVELIQPDEIGVTLEEAIRIVRLVYSKPKGQISQEVGGVGTTLLALCAANDIDMLAAFDAEIERIHNLPIEKFRKRQELNATLGIGKEPS